MARFTNQNAPTKFDVADLTGFTPYTDKRLYQLIALHQQDDESAADVVLRIMRGIMNDLLNPAVNCSGEWLPKRWLRQARDNFKRQTC